MATPYTAYGNPPQASSMSGLQSRITYFMTRNNGLPVPLIPADELPFNIKLQNVPRVLNPEQTYGLQYVGSAPYTGATFKLEREAAPALPMQRSTSQPGNDITHTRSQSGNSAIGANKPYTFLAPDYLARQAQLPKRPISAAETAKSWRRSDAPTSTTPSATTNQSVIDAMLNTPAGAETAERLGYRRPESSSPPPSGIVPDQEKKEYCTHWILQGWCAYEQQGCRYKHEMLDKEGLSKIGIRHVPRWWQERNSPIKLGGIVGPLKKPEEWLKSRKGSDADSERSYSSSGDERKSSLSTVATSDEEEKEAVNEVLKVAKKEVVEESKSPIVSATRPPTPAEKVDKARKTSSGSDLIDFPALLPAPSASNSAHSSVVKPTSPVQILKRPVTKQSIDVPAETKATAAEKPTKTTRIFVPAGESAEKHIAEVKKRERVVRSRSSRPTSSAEVEKPKVEAKSPKVVVTKPEGLEASRWADADDAAEEKKPRKLTKTGCRPRRPASSSPAAKARGNTSAEKK